MRQWVVPGLGDVAGGLFFHAGSGACGGSFADRADVTSCRNARRFTACSAGFGSGARCSISGTGQRPCRSAAGNREPRGPGCAPSTWQLRGQAGRHLDPHRPGQRPELARHCAVERHTEPEPHRGGAGAAGAAPRPGPFGGRVQAGTGGGAPGKSAAGGPCR